jgi:hypothetical protein
LILFIIAIIDYIIHYAITIDYAIIATLLIIDITPLAFIDTPLCCHYAIIIIFIIDDISIISIIDAITPLLLILLI